ncbi:outer membrane protein assembly factor BamE [Sphingomonas sp.]|uniref:outer membrane protein assembly factor BamE n=1 Tax=Sphingomonas sp. TaxID=28214 RepID=UPI001DDF7350|nr:outer membrane protein assembly factor BamE [Sphingomonas sp.]MBX9795556.1 outer membrane protein assembly factor BamE [Sphingomonas sp.]
MVSGAPRRALVLALVAASLAAGGCTRLRGHQGYIVDPDLANSVQAGVDTRSSVSKVLGQPTFASAFGDAEWYYVSRDTRNYAYDRPKPVTQTVLRIRFDDKGVVRSIDRTGMEQVTKVAMFSKVTPTLGRKRSFFQDVFGNIGAVGAPVGGPGGQGGPGGPGGGRTQP